MVKPFDEVLTSVADVEGWMSPDQARRLYDAARTAAPGQRIVEIGSFRGRSMIVLASAAEPGVELVAIDPHAGNDRGPQEIEGFAAEAQDDHAVFNRNLAAAGVADRVRHVRAFSDAALVDVPGAVQVLYVDGAHPHGPTSATGATGSSPAAPCSSTTRSRRWVSRSRSFVSWCGARSGATSVEPDR